MSARVKAVRFHYGCRDCHEGGWLAREIDRHDAIAVHARRCHSRVHVWTEVFEKSLDLDDVTSCVRSGVCEKCGSENEVTTKTFGTRVGVGCLRICSGCYDSSEPPHVGGRDEAVERVITHCEHLGIEPADMTAILATEAGHDVEGGAR